MAPLKWAVCSFCLQYTHGCTVNYQWIFLWFWRKLARQVLELWGVSSFFCDFCVDLQTFTHDGSKIMILFPYYYYILLTVFPFDLLNIFASRVTCFVNFPSQLKTFYSTTPPSPPNTTNDSMVIRRTTKVIMRSCSYIENLLKRWYTYTHTYTHTRAAYYKSIHHIQLLCFNLI